MAITEGWGEMVPRVMACDHLHESIRRPYYPSHSLTIHPILFATVKRANGSFR